MLLSFFFKRSKLTCLSVLLVTQSSLLHAEIEAPSQNFEDNVQGVVFPQWPVKVQSKREMVPPPPPGPYMSTALSDYSIKGPAFTRGVNRPEMGFDSSDIPMATFSPDIPWPDDLKPTNRWMPENGYTFVAPPVRQKPMPMYNNRMPANNFYFNPNRNNQNSRGFPAMGFGTNNFSQQVPNGNYPPVNQYPVNNYNSPMRQGNPSSFTNRPRTAN